MDVIAAVQQAAGYVFHSTVEIEALVAGVGQILLVKPFGCTFISFRQHHPTQGIIHPERVDAA